MLVIIRTILDLDPEHPGGCIIASERDTSASIILFTTGKAIRTLIQPYPPRDVVP